MMRAISILILIVAGCFTDSGGRPDNGFQSASQSGTNPEMPTTGGVPTTSNTGGTTETSDQATTSMTSENSEDPATSSPLPSTTTGFTSDTMMSEAETTSAQTTELDDTTGGVKPFQYCGWNDQQRANYYACVDQGGVPNQSSPQGQIDCSQVMGLGVPEELEGMACDLMTGPLGVLGCCTLNGFNLYCTSEKVYFLDDCNDGGAVPPPVRPENIQ